MLTAEVTLVLSQERLEVLTNGVSRVEGEWCYRPCQQRPRGGKMNIWNLKKKSIFYSEQILNYRNKQKKVQ